MRPKLASALILLMGCCLAPAQANTYKYTAEASAMLIKSYDPRVRGVDTVFGSNGNVHTECGTTTGNASEAFYCLNNKQSIIVISAKALDYFGSKYGLEGIAGIVAHEFAHARLYQINGRTSDFIWTSAVDELQADCVAGVYMKEATPVKMTEEQVDKVAIMLNDLGDYSIAERDWHGSPEMRSISYRNGYYSGNLDSCLASQKHNWGTTGKQIEKEIKNAPETIDSLIRWGQNIIK
jgi:hypothetical protein